MSALIAIVVLLVLVVALSVFCIVNAVRIARHMNTSVNTFRTGLERDANSVLDDLFNADRSEDNTGRPVRSRHPASD